jgi:regulator of sigma E protease
MFDFLNYIPLLGGLLSTLVPFIVVLSIVVAIHEYGHYIVGRWCGIHAEVFSLGFGPVLFSRNDKHGTKWQLAAIPLGGYVRFLGDGDAASGPGAKTVDEALKHKTLNGALLYKRALTVFAGPAANFLLSTVIFAGIIYASGTISNEPVVGNLVKVPQNQYDLREGDRILAINGAKVESFSDIVKLSADLDYTEDTTYLVERDGRTQQVLGPYLTPAIVGWVMPVSPASKAGLKKGDVLLSVGGQELRAFSQLIEAIKASDKEETELKIWRDGQEMTLQITPEFRDLQVDQNTFEKRMMIGVSSAFAFDAPFNEVSLIKAAGYGAKSTYFVISSSLNGIFQIASGQVGAENLQGPLGIAQMSGETASAGFLSFIELIAFISTAIGFLNLLPIPVLDGGHLVMYAYEALFRRPPSTKAVQIAMTMGLTLLLSLMLFATFNDVTRLL